MAPKSKRSKSNWVQCELCGIQLSHKDFSIHETMCKVENVFEFGSVTQKLQYGFITGEQMIGKTTVKDYQIQEFSRSQQVNLLHIHPQTMKMIGLCIGLPVIVMHSRTFVAWPDNSLGPTDVGMTEYIGNKIGVASGDLIVLYSYLDAHLSAVEVVLTSSENTSFLSTPQFANFVAKQIDGNFITSGNHLSFSYGGKPCHLTVSIVTGEDNTVLKYTSMQSRLDATPSEITNTFANLDLSSDSSESTLIDTSRKQTKFYKVTAKTKFVIHGPLQGKLSSDCKDVTLNDFGGYTEQVKLVKDMLDMVFSRDTNTMDTKQFEIEFPRGALIYGPSGCGKSMLCKALIQSYSAHMVQISGSDIWSKFHGESEMNLNRIFKEAKDKVPSIVFIDDVDNLCPKRDTSNSDVDKRVTSALLTLLDDLVSSETKVFILAATSKRDNIDSALRRPGRLDVEVELPVPSASARFEILLKIVKQQDKTGSSLSEENVKHIADNAHGFVGADLSVLGKEACMQAVRRHKSNGVKSNDVSVKLCDLEHGLAVVQPSAMREVAIEVPQVKWDDIGGQHALKYKLKQAIEWPIKYPETFQRLGITPPKGLLMYGPPGCSKTMIAKALARESGINFIAIKGPELFSKWVGESERAVREVFRKARSAAPAIVFFDEIDALAGERGGHGGGGADVSDRVLAQLLTEMDGVEALRDVTVVAATNRPDRIDKALLRPGRLDRIVYVKLPDPDTRREIFKIQKRKMPFADDVNLETLVEKTDRYSGAEVIGVCREAALNAMQEDINTELIHPIHFELALETLTPRITDELVTFYENFATNSALHSI